MIKNLSQLQAEADKTKAMQQKAHTDMTAAEHERDELKQKMQKALADRDSETYVAVSADYATALEKVKALTDAAEAADAMPSVDPNDVIMAWEKTRPALDAEAAKAYGELQKAITVFHDEYMKFARVINGTRLERDKYIELIAPGSVSLVGLRLGQVSTHQKTPAGFTDLTTPYDEDTATDLQHPLFGFREDEATVRAMNVLACTHASDTDF